MKMKISAAKQAFVLIGLTVAAIGCRPDEKPTPEPVGGKGGKATINATAQHHGRNIDSCTIFIKYNTNDAPGNGVYDDSAVCVMIGGKPVATFDSLKQGKYYLYGRGWDTTIKQQVVGGIPFNIIDSTAITYPVNVPVTEGD